MYNLTAFQNATNISGLVMSANQFSGGILITGLTIAIFFVILMQNKGGIVESIAISAYISFIISGILGFLGVLNFVFIIGYLVMAALATFALYMRPGN